jgi:leukotriene-A4 hydrolase
MNLPCGFIPFNLVENLYHMIFRKPFLILGLLTIFTCSPLEKTEETSNKEMKIVDHHSYAQPEEAVITHLNWDADLDFDNHIINATAEFAIKTSPEAEKIILDVNNLDITSVTDQSGNKLAFIIGDKQPFLGSPLTIKIDKSTTKIKIEYSTSPQAEALQWLNPQQTSAETLPFLFTQSQAILCRSWIPIQDSPGIRFSYEAHVSAPKEMLVLMSAENPQKKNNRGEYDFVMKQPIPAYLMALSAGDISYMRVGTRTGVYAEPTIIKAAAWEFEEMEEMVVAAEQLYGPYQWEVYDLLVLPPSFPFGGMENPRLTFATPTILAGDRSLTSLVAHELAHSWSGNLVTNANWDDFWLNEGFTVYFEQRIMEAVYGRDYAEMLAVLSMQDLEATITDLTNKGQINDTHLKLNLEGRNPDDGMTDIAYNKGYFFLRLLEEKVGRETFDNFLKTYFTDNAFKSMTTEAFITYLNKNLFEANNLAVEPNLYDQWIYGPGLPEMHPLPVSDRFNKVEEVVSNWETGTPIGKLISQEDLLTKKWSSHEWMHFIRQLPENMTKAQMQELDDYLQFTYTGNSEVLTAWMIHVIKHQYEPGYQNLENFLISAGRRKFLVPLYGEMAKTDAGMAMARRIYAKARPNYHFVSVNTIDEMLNWQEENNI